MKKYTIQKFIMSNGRPMLREVDMETNKRRLVNLPMTSDRDVPIASYKYAGMTLGEVFDIDKEYVKWIVKSSNASDRIKKGAARLLAGSPYIVREEGAVITEEELYRPENDIELMQSLCQL